MTIRLRIVYRITLVKKRYRVASMLMRKNECTPCFLKTPSSSYFFSVSELKNFLTNPGSV